mmetsp:Transcript_33131/g.72189  ORF Transcript_33131/g.72189 Transcript_33131/m.72189 type:complete len:234 (+) Transcript_33131:526-1227(+)
MLGKSRSEIMVASKRELITEQGNHDPSSSAPQPAPAVPISTRGTSPRAIVALSPAMMVSGHTSPGKQLHSFGLFGRGSLPKALMVHMTEPFACCCIAQSLVHEWSATVPTHPHLDPSTPQRCQLPRLWSFLPPSLKSANGSWVKCRMPSAPSPTAAAPLAGQLLQATAQSVAATTAAPALREPARRSRRSGSRPVRGAPAAGTLASHLNEVGGPAPARREESGTAGMGKPGMK